MRRLIARPGIRLALMVVAGVLAVSLNADLAAGRTAVAPPPRQAQVDTPQVPVNPDADPERTRRTADEILRGDEYEAPTSQRSLLDRIRDWLDRRINRPGFGEDDASTASDIVAWIVVIVVVIGGLAAAVWLIVFSRRRRRAPEPDEADIDIDITPLRTSDEWMDEAERCERTGDHRAAVRARFRSLITILARRDLVADTPGRTAGEMRGDVADRAPDLTPAFGAIADLFERAWYGPGPVGTRESTAARQLAQRAREAAPRAPTNNPEGDIDTRAHPVAVTTLLPPAAHGEEPRDPRPGSPP